MLREAGKLQDARIVTWKELFTVIEIVTGSFKIRNNLKCENL